MECHLRLLGFDVSYQKDISDDEVLSLLQKEKRILLSRDRFLLKRKEVLYGYLIQEDSPKEQLREVLSYYQIYDELNPFHRCLLCNEGLREVRREEIEHLLEPLTKKYFHEFFYCARCEKIFWKGSHYEKMMEFVNSLREN